MIFHKNYWRISRLLEVNFLKGRSRVIEVRNLRNLMICPSPSNESKSAMKMNLQLTLRENEKPHKMTKCRLEKNHPSSSKKNFVLLRTRLRRILSRGNLQNLPAMMFVLLSLVFHRVLLYRIKIIVFNFQTLRRSNRNISVLSTKKQESAAKSKEVSQ